MKTKINLILLLILIAKTSVGLASSISSEEVGSKIDSMRNLKGNMKWARKVVYSDSHTSVPNFKLESKDLQDGGECILDSSVRFDARIRSQNNEELMMLLRNFNVASFENCSQEASGDIICSNSGKIEFSGFDIIDKSQLIISGKTVTIARQSDEVVNPLAIIGNRIFKKLYENNFPNRHPMRERTIIQCDFN